MSYLVANYPNGRRKLFLKSCKTRVWNFYPKKCPSPRRELTIAKGEEEFHFFSTKLFDLLSGKIIRFRSFSDEDEQQVQTDTSTMKLRTKNVENMSISDWVEWDFSHSRFLGFCPSFEINPQTLDRITTNNLISATK